MKSLAPLVLALAVSLPTNSAAAQQTCQASWLPTFGGSSGTNGTVLSFAVFDDGSGGGPALYAGGTFTVAGGVDANNIAKWDGTSWSPLGTGITGGNPVRVEALAVFDDGDGPALYAGGTFTRAGGTPVLHIARWDGASWSAFGGFNDRVRALAVFDDGGGDDLYVGGDFLSVSGVGTLVLRIARWNGMSWSGVANGMPGNAKSVRALAVFDDGSGPALYAAGRFTSAGLPSNATKNIARWDGASWSSLGPVGEGVNGTVQALGVFDDGSGAGPALYVGGDFTVAGTISADRIAKWDGKDWSSLGFLGAGTNSTVYAVDVFDDGSGAGAVLFAAGDFTVAGTILANHIAKWDGSSWSKLGSGITVNSQTMVRALEVFDDGGGGPALHAGGLFTSAGGLPANNIAKWGCPESTPTMFCTAKTTLFCGAANVSATGTSSATAMTGFVVEAGPVRGCRPGLLLYSNQPTQPGVSFGGPGDGLLCLSGMGLRRAGPIQSNSAQQQCDGTLAIDMNEFRASNWTGSGCNPVMGQSNPAGFLGNPGTTVNAQMWGRDSIATGQVLSDGISWTVGP